MNQSLKSMWKCGRAAPIVIALAFTLNVHLENLGGAADPNRLLVDFNPDNGRGDVRTASAHNWPVATGKSSRQQFDGKTFEIRATGSESALLESGWWKAGFDFPATLVSDGVTTKEPGDSIELILNGLEPGVHTIATWHSVWDERSTPSRILAQVLSSERESAVDSTLATQRVLHDDDAASTFLSFTAEPNRPVVVRYRCESSEARVVVCGFAIDVQNPARQVRKCLPANEDEHVEANPQLTWDAPLGRADLVGNPVRGSSSPSLVEGLNTYHVFLGTDFDRVRAAVDGSPEHVGSTRERTVPSHVDDPMSEYYWRVDVVSADGVRAKGRVHRFRIRALAFPGAEGYGRFAIGGRGGRVIEVTNLEDSGPGSLRWAVEAEGPRTIVFRVAGTIRLKSKLIVRNPYVTIAGQTAPGDGICVRGYTFGCLGAHDVIMRYVRIRVGDESGDTMDGTGFASTDHSIFDHCSISWSIDEAVSSRSAKNITLQRCIVAEALNIANHRKYEPGKGHSFAGSISGDIGSFHHNLLAHCSGRNWSLAGGLNRGGLYAGKLDIRNNVVFNWGTRTNDGGAKAVNLVNNLYIPGPASRVFHLLMPDAGSPQDRQQYFVAGNRMEGRFDEGSDNWKEAVVFNSKQVAKGEEQAVLEAIRLPAPFCESFVETHEVKDLLQNVLRDVGANHSGWDSVDQRILQDVANRSATAKGSRGGLPGIIDTQADVGGWPVLKSGKPIDDSDHDGLPDDWETLHGLDPNSPDQNRCLPNQRTTALESYLAEIVDKQLRDSVLK